MRRCCWRWRRRSTTTSSRLRLSWNKSWTRRSTFSPSWEVKRSAAIKCVGHETFLFHLHTSDIFLIFWVNCSFNKKAASSTDRWSRHVDWKGLQRCWTGVFLSSRRHLCCSLFFQIKSSLSARPSRKRNKPANRSPRRGLVHYRHTHTQITDISL